MNLQCARWVLPALVACGLLSSAAPSHAAWSGFSSIGSSIVASGLSCAADGNGTAVCAALGSGGTMIVARYNGSAWSGWTHLTTILATAPSCMEIATGKVICAARDPSLNMVAYLWSDSAWSAALVVQAGLVSAPSCAPLSGGKGICAAKSSSGGLVAATYDGSGWAAGSWAKVAAVTDSLYSAPSCAPDDLGHAICAYLTKASHITTREFTTNWSAALNLSGEATQPPICADSGVGGKVACFATGTDSGLYVNAFSGGSFTTSHWSGWGSLSGLVGGYGCSQHGQKAGVVEYDCGVVGLVDSAFYANDFSGSSWSGWVSHGGAFAGPAFCFALNRAVTPGRVMCALLTPANTASTIIGP